MGRKTIWDLSLEIAGKDKGAEQAIRTVKHQLEDLKAAADQVGKDWKKFTGNATKLALGFAGGVAAATTGVVTMANSFAEAGDKAADTSAALGIGVEAYQELAYAMKMSGSSAQEFDTALQKFSLTVRQGAAGNEAMQKQILAVGLSARNLAGMKPEQALEQLSDYMQALPSDAERTRVAVTLFGKAAGPNMMAAMSQGSEGLRRLSQEARDLGIVLSKEQVKQAGDYKDAQQRLMESFNGMKNQFIGGSIGPLTEAFGHLTKAVMEQMPAIQELGRNFGQWLGGLAERLPEIIGKIKEFGSWVKDTVTGVKDFVGGWENLAKILAGLAITPTFISGLKVVWSLAKFIKIAIAALPLILAGLKVGFAAIAAAAWPIVAIIAGIALVIYTVVKNFDILKQYALDCIERIKAAFGGATGGIAVDWQKVGETAKNVLGIIMSILEGGVLYAIKTVMNAITSAIQSVIGAFKVLWNVAKLIFWPIETIIKVIVGLFTGGWSGAMDAVGGQVAKLGEIFKGIFDGIKIMVGAVADFFKGQFQNAFELINRILGNFGISTESIFEGIAFAVSAAGNFIKNIFGGIGEFFSGVGDSFKNTWSGAVGFVTGIIDGLGGFFRFVFDGVTETIRTVADFIKEIFIDPVNTVKNLVGGIADVFTGIFDAGKEKVQAFVGFFTDKFKVVGDIIGGIGGFFGSIGEKIGNVFGGKGKGADIPGHAAGGIFKQRHIAEIAEKGAEAVVPLNNTSQGFDIWKQAGELGGYLKKASEQAPAISAAAAASSGKTPEPSPVMAAASQKISSGDTAVRIDFKMTNNFNGGTPDGETVKQIAESGQKAGEDFRSKVESIFESMMRDRRRVSYG